MANEYSEWLRSKGNYLEAVFDKGMEYHAAADRLDALEAERDALRAALRASTKLLRRLHSISYQYVTRQDQHFTRKQIAANEAVMKGGA